jgi:hypothetical protein
MKKKLAVVPNENNGMQTFGSLIKKIDFAEDPEKMHAGLSSTSN